MMRWPALLCTERRICRSLVWVPRRSWGKIGCDIHHYHRLGLILLCLALPVRSTVPFSSFLFLSWFAVVPNCAFAKSPLDWQWRSTRRGGPANPMEGFFFSPFALLGLADVFVAPRTGTAAGRLRESARRAQPNSDAAGQGQQRQFAGQWQQRQQDRQQL